MSPTDHRHRGLLSRYLPNRGQTHPAARCTRGYATPLRARSFQNRAPMGDYPEFPLVIPLHRVGYLPVTEQFAVARRAAPLDLHGLVSTP